MTTPCDLTKAGSWPALFGRQAEMELEIGFGNGEYLARTSESNPQRDFVGLEIAWNSFKRALRRLAQPPRSNVRLMHLPAFPALGRFFAPLSLSAARCLFPVPWPNEKHAHKRLFSRSFLDLMSNRLKEGGTFTIVTDHEGLAHWTMEQATNSVMKLELVVSQNLLDTKYERKWLSGGQKTFFHLTGRKIGHTGIDNHGIVDMQPRFSYSIVPTDYHPQGQSSEPTVVFGEFIYDSHLRQGLLATKVVEDQFIQEFHIRIAQQPDGGFKLSPALPSQVYPTLGVLKALDLAALGGLERPVQLPGLSEQSRL
jgi:tRNA (guanine-N7-)-methyltransferase